MAARKKSSEPLPILLAEEVQAAKKAGLRFQSAYRAMKDAERARESAMLQLFQKMGLTSLDQVKEMSPAKLRAAIAKRIDKLFEFENGDARNFALIKTWEGRYPAWKEEVIKRLGAAVAAAIECKAKPKYSYSIIDPLEDPGPDVISVSRG